MLGLKPEPSRNEGEVVNCKPLIVAGLVLGVGLGGFADGIVFHQILQLHNMVTGRIPKTSIVNIEVNMFWDGLFHLFTWIMTVIGIALLWRAGHREDVPWIGRVFLGGLIGGWGLFNLVEGVVDHHLLNAHHVVERLGVSIYDYAFLLSGVAFMAVGWALIRQRPFTSSPA
jgi:uncharacterized membrane protein